MCFVPPLRLYDFALSGASRLVDSTAPDTWLPLSFRAGSEVAQYTAIHFPEFLRKQEEYRDGRLADALEAAFIGFDAHLTEGHVLHELKELAGVTEDEETAEGKGTHAHTHTHTHTHTWRMWWEGAGRGGEG